MQIEDVVLGVLVVIAAGVTFRRDPGLVLDALAISARTLRIIVPVLVLALMAAGFLNQIIPERAIAVTIGEASGIFGILFASVVGALIPGGPMISFPLVVTLDQAGAGPAQLVALITGWSLIAIHRMIAYELTLLGPGFVRRRLAVSAVLAPLSGLIALGLLELFH